MFSKKIIAAIVAGFLFIAAILAYLLLNQSSLRTDMRFVDSTRVFNEFNMSKESRQLGERQIGKANIHLDSLYYHLATERDENAKKRIISQITNEKVKLQQFSNEFITGESAKIWSRINNYTADYCAEKHYKLILGSQKNGDILYFEKQQDITNELLTYLNKRYEGTN